jgi:hypothetical protein
MSQLPYNTGPAQPTPEQRLFLMNEDDWELFIEQCVVQLKNEKNYKQVHRLGGAGDKGRDVCGNTLDRPEAGTWDLYQAKHYGDSLSPSNFGGELAKFIWCVFKDEYKIPRNYFICALKVGPKLYDLVMKPADLKEWILTTWKKGEFSYAFSKELENFINVFDFEIIKIKPSNELLEIHARSPNHWSLFGVLGPREQNPEVPTTHEKKEEIYLKELLKVYKEVGGNLLELTTLSKPFNKHLMMQRRLFYSAEGLNRFSRDKLPGAFDELLVQVELGIGNELVYPHETGYEKIRSVLNVASSLQVTSNPLHARLQAGDLQGSCHHLVNQERIQWIDDE